MNASKDIRRVSLADKLYNARAIWSTYRQIGEETWTRFKGGKEGTLWYFTALCEIFQQTGDDIMTEELVSVVANIKQMSC
jgi:GTP pyrophosphokinase